ncbi:S8 family serine peptidase, partial [Paenisporosarcina sp. TG20]|uniref:S8 family serine peptidase n=1 Tax=Paenisporosarcina sp. TG20 TaxID=1211706 RepID=UPI000683ED14
MAGTIAAAGNNEFGIKGIAPEVDLYAYRVLGAYGSGATSGIIKAIDTAVIEKMDVINLSLGGGANSETDGGSFAINNAMMAGTISVIATGNSGPNRGTMGTPSTARLGIAVGNTTNPETKHSSLVNVTVGEYVLSKQQDLMGTTFGKDPATQLQGEFDLVAVPGNGTASDYNGLDVAGKVVLVSRGAIAFVDKIAYAKANGAAAVLIHNLTGGSEAPNKSGIFLGDSFAFIPTYDLSQTDGDAIRLELAKGEGKVTFGNFASTNTLGDDVNNSSSRGPSTPNFDIKPDVSAPGTNIMSSIAMYQADFPEASYDEAYDRYTGTSMATPHIAGIVALVKQANPNWNAFDVKVALSNTAKVLDTTKYDVFSQGAGRVDAYAAAHPKVLAYGIDTAVLDQSGTTVENLKGTVTYGPRSLAENLTVTKQIRVKDITGNGGEYNVKVDVTKSFGDAKLTIDKPTFTLNGEQMLNVTLTASKNETTKLGDEILGYIHIESADGETEISLPFAADFGGTSAIQFKDYNITETDLSFDGDGVQDEAVLSFTLTGNVNTNYIEIWDIMNPDGGEYGDGYIGYLHASSSLVAGSYTLPIKGQYRPWTSGAQITNIPDGLYTIDFTGQTVSGDPPYVGGYVGPVVVKTTDPVITSETVLVTDKASFEFDGQVTDKYIDYNTELNNYDLGYDLNSKLEASFELTGPDDNVLQNGPITLNQDGSFNLDIPSTLRGNNTLTVTVNDVAGNSGSTEFVIVNEEEDVPDVVTLSVDPSNLDLKVGQTDQLEVTSTVTKPDGSKTDENVTEVATYSGFNNSIVSVDKGNVTAIAEGTTEITVKHNDVVITVQVKVNKADVITLSVNPSNLDLKVGQTDQLEVTSTVTKPDGSKTDENVTEVATYSGFDNSIISVDKGNVSAIAEGTTEITVTYEDVVTTVKVSVNKADVITLSVNPSNLDLKVGQTDQLEVTSTVTKPDGSKTDENVT